MSQKAIFTIFTYVICLIWFLCFKKGGIVGKVAHIQFVLLKKLKFNVPKLYDHDHQLDSFFKNNLQKFDYFNINVTDENYKKVTHKLVSGKTYTVKFFAVTQPTKLSECLNFLKSQNALLAGAQGVTLFWKHGKRYFPTGYTVSLDEIKSLWYDESDKLYKAVGIHCAPGTRWGLQLFFSEYNLKNCCLICFSEESDL